MQEPLGLYFFLSPQTEQIDLICWLESQALQTFNVILLAFYGAGIQEIECDEEYKSLFTLVPYKVIPGLFEGSAQFGSADTLNIADLPVLGGEFVNHVFILFKKVLVVRFVYNIFTDQSIKNLGARSPKLMLGLNCVYKTSRDEKCRAEIFSQTDYETLGLGQHEIIEFGFSSVIIGQRLKVPTFEAHVKNIERCIPNLLGDTLILELPFFLTERSLLPMTFDLSKYSRLFRIFSTNSSPVRRIWLRLNAGKDFVENKIFKSSFLVDFLKELKKEVVLINPGLIRFCITPGYISLGLSQNYLDIFRYRRRSGGSFKEDVLCDEYLPAVAYTYEPTKAELSLFRVRYPTCKVVDPFDSVYAEHVRKFGLRSDKESFGGNINIIGSSDL
jgi:hypothetical protein